MRKKLLILAIILIVVGAVLAGLGTFYTDYLWFEHLGFDSVFITVFLAQVAILKTDAVEAERLTGKANIHQAARLLANLGPAEIVLTHRDGLLVLAGGQYHEVGFYPAELVGRSGRGDTCLAAYTAKRLSATPGEATIWAAAVTSLKMEAEGPFRREIGLVDDLKRRMY